MFLRLGEGEKHVMWKVWCLCHDMSGQIVMVFERSFSVGNFQHIGSDFGENVMATKSSGYVTIYCKVDGVSYLCAIYFNIILVCLKLCNQAKVVLSTEDLNYT